MNWQSIVDSYEPFNLVCFGSFAIVFVVYWGFGLAFLALDYFQKPLYLYQFKIQKVQIDTSMLPKLFKTLILG